MRSEPEAGMWSAVIAFLRRHRLRVLGAVVAIVAVVAAVGLVFPSAIGREPTRTLVAEFSETPGLYTDNSVDILGVATGHVTGVEPGAGSVRVTMQIPEKTKLPRNVRAILMAPNPVSDRTIELYPPYTGGAVLAAGTTIPLARTAVPLGVDQVFAAVDDLAKTLGPAGANKTGSLSQVVKSLARLTRGNGRSLQNTLAALASALPAFSANPGRISALIDSLDKLGATLARNTSTLDSFFRDVARATDQLSDERGTLAAAITNLQDALARTAAFVRKNRSAVTGSVAGLATTSRALVRDQQALTTTFSTAALGFQNFNRAVDLDAPCQPGGTKTASGRCPIVFGRLDLPANAQSIVKTYCKTALLESTPVLVGSIPGLKKLRLPGLTDATPANTACIAQFSTVQGRPGSPGAPAAPDLGLGRFLR